MSSKSLLAETIKEENRLHEELLLESLKHSVRAGEFLAEVQSLLEESKFEAWLKKNCKLSLKEAERHLKLARGEALEVHFTAYRVLEEQETEEVSKE